MTKEKIKEKITAILKEIKEYRSILNDTKKNIETIEDINKKLCAIYTSFKIEKKLLMAEAKLNEKLCNIENNNCCKSQNDSCESKNNCCKPKNNCSEGTESCCKPKKNCDSYKDKDSQCCSNNYRRSGGFSNINYICQCNGMPSPIHLLKKHMKPHGNICGPEPKKCDESEKCSCGCIKKENCGTSKCECKCNNKKNKSNECNDNYQINSKSCCKGDKEIKEGSSCEFKSNETNDDNSGKEKEFSDLNKSSYNDSSTDTIISA